MERGAKHLSCEVYPLRVLHLLPFSHVHGGSDGCLKGVVSGPISLLGCVSLQTLGAWTEKKREKLSPDEHRFPAHLLKYVEREVIAGKTRGLPEETPET